MPSIENIKASDGTANAALATIQSVRAPAATTIDVDTVAGINPAGFAGTMGTPHTFTDPVTSEVITVISEATAVDFFGHVDGSNLEIDTIAPGYTDAGSEIGDIVVIRPTTQWGDEVAELLEVSHNDDGSLIGAAVRTALGESTPSGPGWTLLEETPNTITCNGNRSYNVVINGTDLTDTLSVGMRLKLTRTLPAPTYMGGAFNGTTQYFTKATPSGTLGTVTNNFTIMGWVELTAYGTVQTLCGRADSTPNNGIQVRIETTGQIGILIWNGGTANYRIVSTYQSLPLNKKTHVALSWTSGTVVIYFDGVSVPVSAASTGGTAPTTAGTGGDWSIGRPGAYNAQYLTGYASGVGAFDAVLSASTIRSYMSQVLSGAETNCIGAWSLNNVATDANAAANNLTATGSVSYTARSPYGTQADGTTAGTTEYAIITKTAFSTNTTLTVQVPEGNAIPTSGGVSAVSYSTQKAPYGWPGLNEPLVEILQQATFSDTTVAGVDVPALTTTLTPPANKTIRITVYVPTFLKSGSAGETLVLQLLGDGALIQQWITNIPGSNYTFSPTLITPTFKPTTGSHTYKVRISSNGAGTMQVVGGATTPAFMRVEAVDL